MRSFYTAITIFTLLMLSCSHSPTAGGGSGTETTNSFVFLASGAPAANCRVKLIEPSAWIKNSTSKSGVVLDSAVTDENGLFSIEYDQASSNRTLNLQLDHDSAGLLKRDLSFNGIDSATFTLQKYSVIEGTLEGTQENAVVLVEGTTYSASVENDGTFALHKVPSGSYALFVNESGDLRSGSSVTIPSDSIIQVIIPDYNRNEFLFSDFESGYVVPGMKAAGIPIFWYLFSDSTSKRYEYEIGSWTVLPPEDFVKSGNSSVTSSIMTAENSKGLSMNASLDQTIEVSYAGLGIVFYTDDNSGIDLGSLDSIRCDLQGQGTFKINLICSHPEYDAEVRFSQYHDLEQTVSTVSFGLESFAPDPNTPDSLATSLKEASGYVRMLEFAFFKSDNARENVFFTIDNVVFEGCGVEDLIQ